MAFVNGHSAPTYLAGTASPVGGVTAPPTIMDASIIDGTPVRVVTLALAAAAGIVALRLAGFKFNVGVSA